MTVDPPPPPPLPPPDPSMGPPRPWPAPVVPVPVRRGPRAVPLALGLGVLLAVGQLAAAVGGVALGLWVVANDVPWPGAAPAVGPGYVELTDDEVAEVTARAAEVGAALDQWWQEQLRARGDAELFRPVGSRLTDGDDGVTCDGDDVVADADLVDNAWAGLCDEGPVVAFDPGTFRRSDVALQVILAHEWAHVAQALDPRLDEIVVDPQAPYAETELQADCYAGAWAATSLTVAERRVAATELEAIGDPPDVAPDDPDGHGTGEERVAAFRLGVDGGITACLPAAFDSRPARSP